jgi:predicted RND superfamily exporter protein
MEQDLKMDFTEEFKAQRKKYLVPYSFFVLITLCMVAVNFIFYTQFKGRVAYLIENHSTLLLIITVASIMVPMGFIAFLGYRMRICPNCMKAINPYNSSKTCPNCAVRLFRK